MQEHADERVIGRIFGLFELVVIAAVGIGALVAPIANDLLGSRGALIAAGAVLGVLAVVAHAPLGHVDDGMEVRAAELELLQRHDRLLAVAVRGAQAARLVARRAPRRGGRGDRDAG